MSDVKNELIESLSNILQLDVMSHLKLFLEGELSLLYLLYQRNKPLPPTEISNDLKISKGRVTALISSLKEKDYIDIALSLEDRRKFDITLTSNGLNYLNEKMNIAEQYFEIMIEKIGENKSKQLISLINEIIDVMKEV